MKSESVRDLAEVIRANAAAIITATTEADITDALDHVEAAAARARAII